MFSMKYKPNKQKLEGTHFNIIEAICDSLSANTVLTVPLKLGTRPGCPLFPFHFYSVSIVLKIVEQEARRKN